jgi:IclR family transcriptional regulator, acetate operon repressor
MEILLAVAESRDGLTTKEISERLQIGRHAVYHLLHTLVGTRMLTRGDRNRYLLGLRVGTLMAALTRQVTVADHLAPTIHALARETGETAYVVGWWHEEIATLAVARGTNPVHGTEVPTGYAGNAHARASGKLLLAFAAPAVRDAYLDRRPLAPVTANTATDRAAFERELELIRARGYAVDEQEFAAGLCCLAVALDDGRAPFVLSLSAPVDRFTERRERYLALMRERAISIR